MIPTYIREKENFKNLTPTEKLLLFIIYEETSSILTISKLRKIANLHYPTCYLAVRGLAEKDLIDLVEFGNVLEILRK